MPEISRRWKPELPNIQGADLVGLDIETCDPQLKELGAGPRRDGYMVGFSVAINRNGQYQSWYVPFRHNVGTNLEPEHCIQWAKDNLCNAQQEKVFAHGIYDLDYFYQEDDMWQAGEEEIISKLESRYEDSGECEPMTAEEFHQYVEQQFEEKVKTGKIEKAIIIFIGI